MIQQGRTGWTNYSMCQGVAHETILLQQATFGAETYDNVVIDKSPTLLSDGHTNYLNAIGLRFLGRHLVTLDFPNRMIYLGRRHSDHQEQTNTEKSGAGTAPATGPKR